jgi:ferric-dicitrate binding protein FerR (iron transport regulator)
MRESLDVDINLLSAYLTGELAPGQRALVEQWIASAPGRGEWVSSLRQATGRLDEPPPFDTAAFRARIDALTAPSVSSAPSRDLFAATHPSPMNTPMSHRMGHSWAGRAAIAVFGAAVAFAAVVQLGTGSESRSQTSSPSIYTTDKGQRSTIVLPDGSVVLLNVGSRLQVPANYASGNRALVLSGSAMFSVVPDASSPFLVTAGASVTRVLGTQFVVRHYPEDTATTVAVRDGKVAVGAIVLTADQQAMVSATGRARMTPLSPGQFSVTRGVLTLSDIRLADALPELSRWYNADLELADATIGDRIVNGEFTAGSVTDLAAMLEWTFKFKVVRNGRTLTLYPGN